MKRLPFVLFLLMTVASRLLTAEELDLGARVQPVPMSCKFSEPGYFVWCGSPTKGPDGKFHLYYSRWLQTKCNNFMPGWALVSEIAYAISDKPFGPYHFVNVVLPARGQAFWDGMATHNPTVIQKDGKWLLFYMGMTGDGKNYSQHRNSQRIGVAISDKPEGPWKRFDQPIIDISQDKSAFDSLMVTNPAPVLRPDGSLLVLYKAACYVKGKHMGGRIRYGAAVSDKPEGPYQKIPGKIFEAEGDTEKEWMLAEDPFIWFSKKYGNRYYAITRDVIGKFTGESGGITMFQSDDGLNWKPSAHPKVLGNKFQWADGSFSRTKIERPALLIVDDEPIALFGGADGYLKRTPTFNVQIPLTQNP